MNEESKTTLLLFILLFLCIIGRGQTVEEVRQEIATQGIHHADIVLKQSILETGWYKSYSCKTRNNLFGFRYRGRYLEFATWQDSVAYYCRWQSRKFKGGDYYTFLKSVGYAEDTEYINKLKSIKI